MAKKKEVIVCEDLKKVKRKRLFIENDLTLKDDVKHSVERCVDCNWKDFFTKTIVAARHKDDAVLFKAITDTDDVYLWTSFIQESGYMFNTLAKMAIKTGLTGKRIFIMREKDDLLRYAYFDEKIFRKAAKTNQFFFLDEDRNNFILY